jgi:hypothetical protein
MPFKKEYRYTLLQMLERNRFVHRTITLEGVAAHMPKVYPPIDLLEGGYRHRILSGSISAAIAV